MIMDMTLILERITARRSELGLSESALSNAAGSADLIRNWRRAVTRGQAPNPRIDSLDAIARALQVSTAWLCGTAETPADPAPLPGFAETATPFQFARSPAVADPQDVLRGLWQGRITTPATYRLSGSFPAFGMNEGDVLVVDLARLPLPGECALITQQDDNLAISLTMVRRYAPPFLLPGNPDPAQLPIRVDDPGITVRYPIIGIMRGIPVSK
jgi:transcriptional regulator with XRE-family HTH domain